MFHTTCLLINFQIFYEILTHRFHEKMDSGLNEEALQPLCFVCGDIIRKGKLYGVDFYREMLCKGLKCYTVCSIPGITPSSFCAKCYSTVQNVATGKNVRTGRTLIEWGKCSNDCLTCDRLAKRKMNGRGRKKKVRVIITISFVCRASILS